MADRNTVELNTDALEVDTTSIAAASVLPDTISTSALIDTEKLFRGEFLNGLELPSCYRFYEWCQAERSRYGNLHEEILKTLVSRIRKEPKNALEYAHRLVGLNPFDETAHLGVIELLTRLGRPADALAQAAQCRKIFATELGIEPSEALDDACKELPQPRGPDQKIGDSEIKGREISTSKHPKPAGFFGRLSERQLIQEAFAKPEPDVVLIVGAPGIGKSALLASIEPDYGRRLLSARAVEAERSRPLGVWMDAIRGFDPADGAPGLQNELQSKLSEATDGLEVKSEQQVFDPFLKMLSKLAEEGPVLVALDDLQWCEPSSCALLSYLMRNLGQKRVHFCLAARVGEIDDSDAARALLSGLGVRLQRIALTGLPKGEAMELAQELLPQKDVKHVVRRAQGNPLYLRELSRMGGQAETTHSLRDALSNRIGRLSHPAINLASWASVFGRTFPMDTLIETSGTDFSEALELIEELERHEIIRTLESGSNEFTHDLVRDAAYERLSSIRRRLMHGKIADHLSRDMNSDQEQAAHVLHHSAMSDRHLLAARAATIAGDRLLKSYANSEADVFSKKGLFHVGKLDAGPERASLTIHLLGIQVLAASGKSPKGLSNLAESISKQIARARQHAMAAEVAHGEYLMSVIYQELGNHKESSLATARAADAATRMDTLKRIRQQANSARCLLELGRDIPKAEILTRDAGNLAENEGVADIEVFWSQALLAYWNGDLALAADMIVLALDLARASEDRWRECKCLAWAAMIALERELPNPTIEYATELNQVAARIGEGAMGPLARAIIAMAKDDDKSLATALKALEVADDKSHLAYVFNIAALRQSIKGNTEAAIRLASRAFDIAEAIDSLNERAFAQSLALLLGKKLGDVKALGDLAKDTKPVFLMARVYNIVKTATQNHYKETPKGN